MKSRNLRWIVFGWLLLLSFKSFSQQGKNCETNCFGTEVVEILEQEGGCYTYTLKVNAGGDCSHALSHYSVATPQCATIAAVSNSEDWKIEYGTDPTSGISGFKVDEIQDFGEEAGEFYVTFTLCDNGCEEALSCFAPEVAYKAATCVYYEQTEVSCVKLEANLIATNLTCAEENNGIIEIEIVDGTAPFTYAWSNGATTESLSELAVGSYSVIITDGSGATLELATEISAPPALAVVMDITDATCSGQSDGAINASVSGGTAPYTYSWSNGISTEDQTGLRSGYYLLTVTDANGCENKTAAIIDNTVTIAIDADITNAGCNVNNGTLDVTIEGGAAPYTFSWNNGATTEDLSDLAPGAYRITVTDANGCFSARTFSIRENNPLRLTSDITNTACVENNSGAIDLTVIGGEAPYTYAWSNGANTEDIGNLAADTYTVTVTDATSCSITQTFNVTANSFSASSMVNQISCAGEADANITLLVSGGETPYTYDWSNGATSDYVENLSAGQYSVEISDATGCSKSLSFTIVAPAAIAVNYTITNATCTDGDYSVALNTTGGRAPYTYLWNNGETGSSLSNLLAGEYTVEVTDANGCTSSVAISVSASAANCSEDDNSDDTDDDNPDDGSDDSGDDTSDEDDGSGDGDNGDGDNDNGDEDGGNGGEDEGEGDDDGGEGDGNDGGEDDGDSGNPNQGNCENPFETSISLVEINDNCYTYEATVTYDGNHVHGLSHLSVAVPCGDLDFASTTSSWPIDYGTDPTTGISGFKIDNINNFGEGISAESFDFTFTICNENDDVCKVQLLEADFEVAYKYGQCVSYELVDGEASLSESISINTYPNPFTEQSTFEFYTPTATNLQVDVYNRQGVMVRQLFKGNVGSQQSLILDFVAEGLPSDIYTYRIVTDYGVEYRKVILTN